MKAFGMASMLRALLRGYQLVISPLLGPRCRFHPSCSDYAREALAVHGAATGSWLALKRLLRCHPWGGSGYDPVPTLDQHPHSHARHPGACHKTHFPR